MNKVGLIVIWIRLALMNNLTVSARKIDDELLENLKKFDVVIPHLTNRNVAKSTLEGEVENIKKRSLNSDEILISLPMRDRTLILELDLNTDILSNSFTTSSVFQSGRRVFYKPSKEDINFCHYRGHVRGYSSSHVSISTCDGIKGAIFFSNETFLIEPMYDDDVSLSSDHVLFRPEDVKNVPEGSCGHDSHKENILSSYRKIQSQLAEFLKFEASPRKRRDTSQTLFVQLLMVADSIEVNKHGSNLLNRVLDLMNMMDVYWIKFNIRVILIHLEKWNGSDPITLSTNSLEMLNLFQTYKSESKANASHGSPWAIADHAALLYGGDLNGTTLGIAYVAGMCSISSVSITQDYVTNIFFPAAVMTHELGHNFGMQHDDGSCVCEDTTRCIMEPSISLSTTAFSWSNCSYNYLIENFEFGTRSCLFDVPDPDRIVGDPICGNQVVEEGEQCDCGHPSICKNPCCNSTTCLFLSGAVCAEGACCNETCQFKEAGIECRGTNNKECQLSEYCTGTSENCPGDFYREDGTPCLDNTASCFEGVCETKNAQCKLFWGPNALSCSDGYYSVNTIGELFGNCGSDSFGNYTACTIENQLCGKLLCYNGTERPFTTGNVFYTTWTFSNGTKCRVIAERENSDMVDPFLVRTGTNCNNGKVCSLGDCVQSMYSGENYCYGNGVVNNRGTCFCAPQWAPPFCNVSGYGGSLDGGPNNINGITVSFTSPVFTVVEGEDARICVRLSAPNGPLVSNFSFGVLTASGTAKVGDDYSNVFENKPKSISFSTESSNGVESCFSIATTLDDLVEPTEHFSLQFTNFLNGKPGQVAASQVDILSKDLDATTAKIQSTSATTSSDFSTTRRNEPTTLTTGPTTKHATTSKIQSTSATTSSDFSTTRRNEPTTLTTGPTTKHLNNNKTGDESPTNATKFMSEQETSTTISSTTEKRKVTTLSIGSSTSSGVSKFLSNISIKELILQILYCLLLIFFQCHF